MALCRFIAGVWCLLAIVVSPAQAAERQVHVYVNGAIPGLSAAQLPGSFADMMNELHLRGWAFVPGDAHAPLAADRIQWTIKPLPYAGGAAVRHGRLMSAMDDLFGHYRYVRVDVRLYLDGAFQTTSFITADIQGGAHDPKLVAIIADLTEPLVTTGLDPEHVSPSVRP